VKKTYNGIIILILIVNVVMGIVLFQQSVKLTKLELILSTIDAKMEDLDDAHEEDIIPRLEKILNEK
jgi:regulatory protein YycI of two-component signal transduction system YycFG